MIGLKRHTVKVVPHESAWLTMGIERCRKISEACGALIIDVQHVGSTSIPDLPAKPILDIVVGVDGTFCIEDLQKALEELGYIYRGLGSGSNGHLFVMESSPEVRTEHLHVVVHGSSDWRDYTDFKAQLIASPEYRKQYAELKSWLVKAHHSDRKEYTASKETFIKSIIVKQPN